MEAVLALTDDEEDGNSIASAIGIARSAPDSLHVAALQEALGVLNAWYPIAQRERMRSKDTKADWQFVERYLAGHIDTLKSNLIASMWLGKIEANFAR